MPLLIVVSAADPASGRGFAQWLGDGLGVSTAAREDIERLFALPGQTLRTTTAFGLAALAVFGVSFGATVRSGYEQVWDLPPARLAVCVRTGFWHTFRENDLQGFATVMPHHRGPWCGVMTSSVT